MNRLKNNRPNTNYQVISFDLDNALYNNQPVLAKAEAVSADYLAAEFKRQNKKYNFQSYLDIRQSLLVSKDISYENLSYFRQVALKQFCQDLHNSEEVVSKAFSLFIEARSQVEMPLEIVKMLELLAADFTLVSVTNGNCEMQRLSISHLFSKNYSASGGYRAKPHPQMLLEVIKDFNLKPQNLLHVGDSLETDGGAAKQAKIEFFHFAPFVSSSTSIQEQCQLLLNTLYPQ